MLCAWTPLLRQAERELVDPPLPSRPHLHLEVTSERSASHCAALLAAQEAVNKVPRKLVLKAEQSSPWSWPESCPRARRAR